MWRNVFVGKWGGKYEIRRASASVILLLLIKLSYSGYLHAYHISL